MLYITYYIEEFDGVGSAHIVHEDKIEQFFRDEVEFIGEDGFEEGEDEESEITRCVNEFKVGAAYGRSFSVTVNGREHHFETLKSCLTKAYLGEYRLRALEGFLNNLDN